MKRFLFLLITILAVTASGGVISSTGQLSQLGNGWGGEGYYFTVNGASNGCSSVNRFVIPIGFAEFKDTVANVMIAYTQKLTVRVDANGCLSGGTNGAAVVVGVTLP